MGCVLAQQGESADRLILLERGDVSLVLEGDSAANPMDPYARRTAQTVPGGAAAVRSALEQGHTGMGRKRCALSLAPEMLDVTDCRRQASAVSRGTRLLAHVQGAAEATRGLSQKVQ